VWPNHGHLVCDGYSSALQEWDYAIDTVEIGLVGWLVCNFFFLRQNTINYHQLKITLLCEGITLP